MLFECKICSYTSSLKSDYKRHLDSKKHINLCKTKMPSKRCEPLPTSSICCEMLSNTKCQNNVKDKDVPRIKSGKINLVKIVDNMKTKLYSDSTIENYNCEFCNKHISYKRNLRSHLIKVCKYIPQDFKNHLINIHNKNGNTKTKLHIVPLDNKGNVINNINNSNTTNNNNIHNNITINNNLDTTGLIEIFPMMNETLDHLTEQDKLDILSSPEDSIKILLDKIYSNPSNLNAYINSKTDRTISYLDYRNNKITTDDKDRVLKKLCNNHMGNIDGIFEDVRDKLSPLIIRKTKELFNLFDDDEPDLIRYVKKLIFIKLDNLTDDCKEQLNNLTSKKINGRTKYFSNLNNNTTTFISNNNSNNYNNSIINNPNINNPIDSSNTNNNSNFVYNDNARMTF